MADSPRSGSSDPRATWLVLAAGGPGLDLARSAPTTTRIRTVADPAAFATILMGGRPRIAILAEPPATAAEIDLVIRERRRRPGLRTIHLSPHAAAASRLDALRQGFDEALSQSIDAVEQPQTCSSNWSRVNTCPGG